MLSKISETTDTYLVYKNVIGGIFGIIISIIILIIVYFVYKSQNTYNSWQSVKVQYLDSYVDSRMDTNISKRQKKTKTRYYPHIDYKYTYNGKTYNNFQISNIDHIFDTKGEAENFITSIMANDTVLVNTDDPLQSILKVHKTPYVIGIFFVIAILILIWSIVMIVFRDNTYMKMNAAIDTIHDLNM